MTTLPTTRAATPMIARPQAQGSATGSLPTIDPIKLLQRFKWLLMGAAVAGLFLGTVAHYVWLYVYPKWTPFTVFECSAVANDPGSQMPAAGFEKELDKFMQTQVQTLLSDSIMDKVVSDPTLMTEAPKWSKQFVRNGTLDAAKASKELKKKVSAGVVGESYLIRLSFWWTDPNDATAIVKLLAQTYLTDRKQIADNEYYDRKSILSRTIADSTAQITQLQTRRSRLLLDKDVDTLEQQNSSTLRNMQNIQEKLVETRADEDSLRVRREQMQRELESPSGPTYSDEIRKRVDEEPTIIRIKEDLNTLESELTAARKRFGSDHPQIRRLQTMLEGKEQNLRSEREKQFKQQFDATFDTIKTTLSGMAATVDDLLKKLGDERIRAVELSQTLASVKDLDSEIARLNESRNKFQDDLKNIEILTVGPKQSRVIIRQPAQRPKEVSFPKLYVMMPAGAVLVLGLVCGVILLVEVVDQRVKSPADVAMVPRTRVLGLVPHASEDPAAPARVESVFRDNPSGVLAEHFRQLRGSVLKRLHAGGHKSLVVMSGQPGSGATTVVCNLAQSLASAEQNVLVIDANFRRPGLHRVFGLGEGPGLADVLAGQKSLAEAVQKTDDPRLCVLTAGSADKRRFERLATEPMSELLRQAGTEYDIILLDVSPASISGDAMAVANRCDATVLVVRAFGETRGMVARLRNELSEVRAEFLGVVVNAVRSSAGGYLRGNILATHQYQNEQNT